MGSKVKAEVLFGDIHLYHFSSYTYFILGFETVSYLLEGEFIHEDCLGHKGLLKAGDLQWITAGKGIIHSEMPGPIDTRGLQLWVNLKNENKMVEPKYQELEAKEIPFCEKDGVHVKVIAGESMGIKSPVKVRIF